MPTNPLDSSTRAGPAAGAVVPKSPGQGVQQWRVEAEFAGQRIDNYLLARLKGVPKTRIYRMLRTGEVRVNGGRVGSDYRLEAEDRLRIPPLRLSARIPGDGERPRLTGSLMAQAQSVAESLVVLMDDDVMLAISKPCGLAVHGGSGVRFGVIEALRAKMQSRETGSDIQPQADSYQAARGPNFLELVHRLDRETSGLMLLAKRRGSLVEFHRQLREGQMRKRYLALVWGAWPGGLDRIEAPLHKWVNARGERWVRIQEDGQAAITRVRVLQRLEHPELGDISFLQCEPLTGRTHQLRVHLASQGHPIIGDPKYGLHERDDHFGPKGSGQVTRMFLHAWRLRFSHPVGGQTIELTAPVDARFQSLLDLLGAKDL